MDLLDTLFRELESNQSQVVDHAKFKFRDQLNGSKESWLVNGLVDYFLVSNSLRAVDLLVSIREPHDKYFFDRLAENFRTPQSRIGALTLLGHISQRQPTWLYKIVRHPTLMKDLLKILKTETDMVEVISALLVLNVLLPMIPGLIGSHLIEIFQVFSRLAAWNTDNTNRMVSSHILHLQVALYALFYQLYGMFPCTFLNFLKQEYNNKSDSINSCNVFNHTVKPMIETVRLHPFLIMSSSEEETCADRWKKIEHHDNVYNCTRFLLDANERSYLEDAGPILKPPHTHSSLDTSNALSENSRYLEPVSPNISSTSNYLNCGPQTPTFSLISQLDIETVSGNTTPAPTGVESTPTSIPHTPIFKMYTSSSFTQQEGSSPPEAAIEATPETTPVKDVRQVPRTSLTSSSNAVRALHSFPSNDPYVKKQHGDTPPSSPMKTKDIFNFPSNAESRKAVSRLVDERIIAQETFITGNERKAGIPTSPYYLVSSTTDSSGPIVTTEEKEPDLSSVQKEQMSDSISKEPIGNTSKCKADFNDSDLFFDEECSQDSGSPCNRGGLHMPGPASMKNFRTRQRYQTETNMPTSQSLGLCIGSSPGECFAFPLMETRVRRAVSCPEMKKSIGGSLTGSIGSTTMPLKEQDEDEEGNKNPKPLTPPLEERSTQTDDFPPNIPPYEHLFLGIFPITFSYHQIVHNDYGGGGKNVNSPLPDAGFVNAHSVEACCLRKVNESISTSIFKPYESIDKLIDHVTTYRSRTKSNAGEYENRFYKEQLALMNLQLNFERHRREVHSERNRRLLGKSRSNRALEEHNSALQDQVSLLQKDIENSNTEMGKNHNDSRLKVELLESNVKRLKCENLELHKDVQRYKSRCESLEQDMKAESEKRGFLNQILHETKAKLYDSNNEMDNYKEAILENKRLNNELSYLQKEIIILGEMSSKYKDILSYLAQLKNEHVYSDLFNEAYTHQIVNLHKLYETQTIQMDSIKKSNIKLHEKLKEKNQTLQQFKMLFSTIKHQYHEQLEAMTSRYNSVQTSLMRQRDEQLELYYQIEMYRTKLSKFTQKYPNIDKTITSSLGAIPSTSQPNNPNNLMSLSSFVVRESDPTELIEKD